MNNSNQLQIVDSEIYSIIDEQYSQGNITFRVGDYFIDTEHELAIIRNLYWQILEIYTIKLID